LEAQGQPGTRKVVTLPIITKDIPLRAQAEQLVISLDTEVQMADLG
jgi:hypothetical protein